MRHLDRIVCFLSLSMRGALPLLILSVANHPGVSAQPSESQPALYRLSEMDMHLHAGRERPVPLPEWLDAAAADGRKAVLALDHRELYDMPPGELAAWIAKDGLPSWYPAGREGKEAFFNDLAAQAARKDLLVFRGWEIWEGELDEGLDREGMRLAEAIGWHISANGDPPPCGKMIIRRIRQIIEVQKEFPIPMIVFHPFSMRIERALKDAKKKGQPLDTLTADDYRFFQPGEQEQVARLLQGKQIFIEIALEQGKYMENPAMREALIADIKPLAEAGIQFTVSTDAHGMAHIRQHFDPETYCAPIGVTPENANGLVQALIENRRNGGLNLG